MVANSHVAVVMPAYNESEGIVEFLEEIVAELTGKVDRLDIVVADDRSKDDTVERLRRSKVPGLRVAAQPVNRGHGPTALAAYREGLETGARLILHVDGDGQFTGADIAKIVLAALADDSIDVLHGVRNGREDPWYRRSLSSGLRLVSRLIVARAVPDLNTPLRAYRPDALRLLLEVVGTTTAVPHVHWSLAEVRAGLTVRYLPVQSIPRRGKSAVGTMWGADTLPKLPPPRLRAFVGGALAELWRVSLAPGSPGRRIAR